MKRKKELLSFTDFAVVEAEKVVNWFAIEMNVRSDNIELSSSKFYPLSNTSFDSHFKIRVETWTFLQVYKPSKEEFDSSASSLTGENSELEDIVHKGKEQSAVQLSIGILSAVNALARINATTNTPAVR